MLTHRLTAAACVLVFLSGWACSPQERASIQENREVIRTYPFGEPDPVPVMTRSGMWGKGNRLYPYSFIDDFSKTAVEREWTVVRLENPYIEVSVLPEVGGKIRGARELSTGREFIYTNHVLKFREVALRGPWTSGGIEFNFGIVGHTPAGAHPVNYLVREHDDGSVSCVVGHLDLPSRTRWSVTLTLPPDKAYFETRALWHNASPLHQAYYVWMNGAIRTADDLEYRFPGRSHIAHNFDVPLRPWPVDENGRDLSWYRNNDFGSYKSYFTIGEYQEFFGGYWHDDRFGFGHWARYDDMPGHKIWIWGLSRQGMIWEDLLTDADGQYSEPQAGRYLNQNDHALFVPYTVDTWREIWFPYKDIGPLDQASPQAVLNVAHRSGSLEIAICPLQGFQEDLVVVLTGGKELHRESLRLEPMRVVRKTLALDLPPEGFEVHLGPGLAYRSNPHSDDLKRPLRFHVERGDSVESRFLEAGRLERERSYYQALEIYLEVLDREPLHTRALCRAAELCYRRAEYDRALELSSRALDSVMYDPEANYLYGITARRMGDLLNAKETLGWASRSPAYRAAAACQMGEIHLMEGRLPAALEYARKAKTSNTNGLNPRQLEVIVLRKLGRTVEAEAAIRAILEIDPLNHLARFERHLLDPSEERLRRFQALIRCDLPHEIYLETALIYANLRLEAEARAVLDAGPIHPTLRYWTAFLSRESGPAAREELDRAAAMSPELVFPFRAESIPVFRWAAAQTPEDWKPRYYLALIHWGMGRIEEARTLLEECGTPDFAPLAIIRAYFLRESDPTAAIEEYEKAVRIDPDSWRNRRLLLDFLNRRGRTEQALSAAREATERFPGRASLEVELVRALMSVEDYSAATVILDNMEALPSEGATAVHGLYVDCHLRLAMAAAEEGRYEEALSELEKSRDYPENLGSGKPYHPDTRLQDYLSALCHDRLGQRDESERLRRSIRDYTLEQWPQKKTSPYIGGLILRRFGPDDKARILLAEPPPDQAVMDLIRRLESGGLR